ncbi:MAG: DUF1292 domain-containing protein [Eubacteriales bacterium]|nr:DUF1292 domain-containing protein [Eubacteriales bacterium]
MQKLHFVVMDFEEGREQVDCLILSVFDFEGAKYIALAPEDEDDMVYLFEYVPTGVTDGESEEFEILDIEDDDLYDRVVECFNDLPCIEAQEDEAD